LGGENMCIANNPSAGIANPYWYEWSVGLLYVIDMLDTDTNIKSVILQESKLQGLDDVVINYKDGKKKCIQVKHTRENNSLTFSDMIRKGEKGGSYISQFAKDWKKVKNDENTDCKAILFTNREYGNKKYTKKENDITKYERPPLVDFWPYIKKKIKQANSLKDIVIDETWTEAWNEWLNELNVLKNEDEKLEFLKCFDIKASEGDLDVLKKEITEKIKKIFSVEEEIAIRQYQKLCFSLMEWTTTFRKKEEIEVEDVYEALSLHSDPMQGIHDLKVPSPFFPSRLGFVNDLENKLRNRESPIIFLSGEPGCGKTSIVSYLTNKVDSVISLRFYSFKPISPEDEHFTSDKGISSPRALWGDLLIQLRERLRGKRSKYSVPVSNELLDTVDRLKEEVLRLASILAKEENKTIVIAIDGIDHAARAESKNTFIETLVPPEEVPKNVCFLIAGQPIHEYPSYPDWLSYEDNDILKLKVPKLDEGDIKALYQKAGTSIPNEYTDSVIRLIGKVADGNTLSIIYAVFEAKQCKSVEALEKRLEEKRLASGLTAYYEYTWKSALELVPRQFLVDYMLAGTISLINRKIKPNLLVDIYDDVNIEERVWKSILRKLNPILIEDNDGFRILHNDVRVYLEKYLRKNTNEMKDVTSKIADYYIKKSDDLNSKHEIVFKMLKLARRKAEYIDVFTSEYVMEAVSLSRPMNEIEEQLEKTMNSLSEIIDFSKVLSFSCAVSTLYQFKQSMQWVDRDYHGIIELPPVLSSERKVMSKSLFTKEDLLNVTNDVLWLIDFNELPRAISIMNRWFSKYSPENIIDSLKENNQIEVTDGKYVFDQSVEKILENWGRICQYTEINFEGNELNEKYDKYCEKSRALFYRGWLAEGLMFDNRELLERTIGNVEIYYISDMEEFILGLINKNNLDKSIELSKKLYSRNNGSKMFILRCLMWMILSGNEEHFERWISEVREQEFDYIKDVYFNLTKDSFEGHVLISFVLSYFSRDYDYILMKSLSVYREGTASDREKIAIEDFLSISTYLGGLVRDILLNNKEVTGEDYDKFECMLRVLIDNTNLISRYDVGGFEIEKLLMKVFIFVGTKLYQGFDTVLYKVFKEQVSKFEYSNHIDVYWNYLKDKNEIKLLENWFDYWLDMDGHVWDLEIDEMYTRAEKFIDLAEELKWGDKIEIIEEILKWKSIGYSGRKDYSIYTPLKWFKLLSNINNLNWKDMGIELLNISKTASELGDNRANIFVEGTVASAAGKIGFKHLWEFACLEREWDRAWIQNIFDGLIASMENTEFSLDELKNIWRVSTAILKINKYSSRYDSKNNIKKVYLDDIRTSIMKVSEKLGYKNMDKDMLKIAQEEYLIERDSYDYKVPTRWYEDKENTSIERSEFKKKIECMCCDDALKYISEVFYNEEDNDIFSRNFSWYYISEFLNKYKEQINREKHIYPLFNMVLKRKNNLSWESDGVLVAFEAIFLYLEDEQIHEVLMKIINDFNSLKSIDRKIDNVNSNLEHFIYFYYKNKSEQDIEKGLKQIMNTHLLWITGNGIIDYRKKYDLIGIGTELPESWNEFSYKLICKFSKARLIDSIEQYERIELVKKQLEKTIRN
jgi:hypothetical protein